MATRQPLAPLSPTHLRQSPPGPSIPSVNPRRSATHWSRYLETDDIHNTTEASQPHRIQREYPGIKPNPSGHAENDQYSTNPGHETFTIRCIGTGHTTTVHSAVVLRQSRWLREAVEVGRARQEALRRLRQQIGIHDDDTVWLGGFDNRLEVGVPRQVGWHQVGWALEYMYTGRVPGFHALTREEAHLQEGGEPASGGQGQARSIVWGLQQLWGAAVFFCLPGLTRRACKALWAYLRAGLRREAKASAAAAGSSRDATSPRAVLQTCRFIHELTMAANILFQWSRPPVYDLSYLALVLEQGPAEAEAGQGGGQAVCRWRLLPHPHRVLSTYAAAAAARGSEVRAWERGIFEEGPRVSGDPWAEEDGAVGYLEARADAFSRIFQPMLVDLCVGCAKAGLFELGWFQVFLSSAAPPLFLAMLSAAIDEPRFRWVLKRYPRAPYSFEVAE